MSYTTRIFARSYRTTPVKHKFCCADVVSEILCLRSTDIVLPDQVGTLIWAYTLAYIWLGIKDDPRTEANSQRPTYGSHAGRT